MKKLLIPIIILIGIGVNAFAQEKSRKEVRGDKYFFVYAFDKAIDSYTHTKKLSVEGQRRLAKSYQNLNQSVLAEEAYSKLTGMPGGNLPDDDYNYAMVLRADGKYDQSATWMDKFKDLKPNDLRAKDYVANGGGLSTLLKDDGKFKVNALTVNTGAEDFGTSYYKDKIVFASSRTSKFEAKKYNWNGQPFLDLYVSDVQNGQLKSPVIFDKELNGAMHDGPASFTRDGNYMAFTRNNYDLTRKELIVRVEICFSTYKDGKWSKPEPFILNSKEYSVGHPCLTSDGKTMYFTSDKPGGFGGVDIYRIAKNEQGTWGTAENLGDKINTEGDELYPFYEENNKMLFFSSNGRFGLGGLDIFTAEVKGSGFENVHNAGVPLNSQYDDFALISDSVLTKGYVSSNRSGGSGDDDIYSVDLFLKIEKKIKGIAMDIDGKPIFNTAVTLMDDNNNVLDTATTKEDGAYTFVVAADKSFKLNGRHEFYFDGNVAANTLGKESIVTANLILLQRELTVAEKVVEQKIQVGEDLGKILALNPIYFDYDKANIRPDAEIALKKIAKIMNDHPEMVVELGAYADCRGTAEYNQVLSDKRAKSSADYIKKRITKPARIDGKGYGETKLVNACSCEGAQVSSCSEEEFQLNRRTEFIILKHSLVNNSKLSDH